GCERWLGSVEICSTRIQRTGTPDHPHFGGSWRSLGYHDRISSIRTSKLSQKRTAPSGAVHRTSLIGNTAYSASTITVLFITSTTPPFTAKFWSPAAVLTFTSPAFSTVINGAWFSKNPML